MGERKSVCTRVCKMGREREKKDCVCIIESERERERERERLREKVYVCAERKSVCVYRERGNMRKKEIESIWIKESKVESFCEGES